MFLFYFAVYFMLILLLSSPLSMYLSLLHDIEHNPSIILYFNVVLHISDFYRCEFFIAPPSPTSRLHRPPILLSSHQRPLHHHHHHLILILLQGITSHLPSIVHLDLPSLMHSGGSSVFLPFSLPSSLHILSTLPLMLLFLSSSSSPSPPPTFSSLPHSPQFPSILPRTHPPLILFFLSSSFFLLSASPRFFLFSYGHMIIRR